MGYDKAVLIQSRMSSVRFPGKMLKQILGISLVEYVYRRCLQSKKADKIVVLTSMDETDDVLYKYCKSKNIDVFRGSLYDVLKRYIDASKHYGARYICRVCGDSPFVDIDAVDKMLDVIVKNQDLEYITTTNSLNGFMSEVFTFDLLEKIYNSELSSDHREHVTKYVRDNIEEFKTKKLDLDLKGDGLDMYTLTVDYRDDLQLADYVAKRLKGFDFTSYDVLEILKNTKEK